jgi:hypothetical protein
VAVSEFLVTTSTHIDPQAANPAAKPGRISILIKTVTERAFPADLGVGADARGPANFWILYEGKLGLESRALFIPGQTVHATSLKLRLVRFSLSQG